MSYDLNMLSTKKQFLLQIFILVFIDFVIVLNIPYIRQLSIIYFTVIPGIVILQILRLSRIGMLKIIVLSIGLSLSFLIFYGYFVNFIYFELGFSTPLATFPLLISINIALIILFFVNYILHTTAINVVPPHFYSQLNIKSKYVSLAIFPILFPFLAIFGTTLMDKTQNNIILMVMLFLIPAYIVLLVLFKKNILKITYPLSIYTISLSLLLMHGLTSNYLNGRDVHMEYYAARVVSSNLHWSMSNFSHELTACLSTSLLPSIYWSLSGVEILYIYKIYYQIIWATTPLICYIIFSKYLCRQEAFLASLFFIFQMPFIFDLQSAMRTQIALFFVALLWLVYFSDDIDKINKKVLFLIFMFSMIFSHYSTSYLFFFIILILWLCFFFIKNTLNRELKYGMSGIIVLLSISVLFLWYSQITNTSFSTLIRFINEIILTMGQLFEEDVRSQGTYIPSQENLALPSYAINLLVMWITFALIAVGVFDSIRNYIISKKKDMILNFEIEYIIMATIFGIILVAFLILPYASQGYGNNRIYQQLLIILAIFFVIGGHAISKYTRGKINGTLIILFVLISQFFCATLVIHQVFGVPYSQDLNRDGDMYKEYYLHDQEIVSSRWLSLYSINNSIIHTDYSANTRLLMGCQIGKLPKTDDTYFIKNETLIDGYLYLRYENVVYDSVRVGRYFDDKATISRYKHLFIKKNLIYNNNGSKIYN